MTQEKNVTDSQTALKAIEQLYNGKVQFRSDLHFQCHAALDYLINYVKNNIMKEEKEKEEKSLE